MAAHNQYCQDDWTMYHGDGPRGLGPNGDGCVCSLDPAVKFVLPRPGEVAGTGPPLLPDDHPIMKNMSMNLIPLGPDMMPPIDWSKMATHFDDNDMPCNCNETHVAPDRRDMPRLWGSVRPEAVVHIAGACLTIFGRYMRQRCDWCGIILLEYDLVRIAVPTGQDATPPSWAPGSLVRVDGHMSASIANPEVGEDGSIQLKSDACVFDPATQIP